MNKTKKLTTVNALIDCRIESIRMDERRLLESLTVEYLGPKYRKFSSDDLWVLLEEHVEAHPDAYSLSRTMNEILVLRRLLNELSLLKTEIIARA